ncbi:sensor histidine kinase [Streptomyces sp. NPDC096136]|uniref:sensor histidine kinase n=1 Tax=Streptomyces sp. NPDC096136 TaxID=3366076 RepID=UPI00380BD33E
MRFLRLRRPLRGPARAVAETAWVLLAGLGVWVAVAHAGMLPRPYLQLPALALGAALFPLRRRFPAAVLLVLAALTGLAVCVGPATAATAYTVARRTARARRRARLLAAAAALLVVCATVAAPWLGPGPLPYGPALGLVLTPTAVLVPGLVGTSYGQQRRLVRALRERGDAAERARRFADSEARIHERSRIAAEMHDLVGHRLSLISLHAGGLELALERSDPELREEAVLVRRTTRDAMRELRQALGVLGPLGRDTGPEALTDATGTRADIEALVAESRDGGVAVRLDWTGPDLDTRPAGVRRAVHRVVREALTNVHRYASAAHVAVTVAHGEESVRVTVRNGAPPTVPAPAGGLGTGRGLTGLRERVELLGGGFTAAPLPSGGFRVEAVLPAEPGDAPAPRREAAEGDPGSGARAPGGADPGRGAVPVRGADPVREAVPGRGVGDLAPVAADRTGAAADRTGAAADRTGVAADRTGDPAERGTAQALALALGMVALCVLMVLGTLFVYATAPHRDAGPPPPPRIGMTYDDVRGVTDNAAVRAAATGREPPRPPGTAGCVYPFNGATESRPGSLTIARYCFDSGQRLIAIDRFTVPSVRDATPWETP